MKIVYLIFSAMCLVGGYFYFAPSDPLETDKCENVFTSDVASDYYQQLGIEIPEGAKERRSFHEAFVSNLRQDPSKGVANVFLSANLTSAYQRFLNQFIPPYHPGEDLIVYLENSLKRIRALPSFSGLNHNSSYDDSLMEGNLPFLQFMLPNSKKTAVIRMAMPALDEQRFFSNEQIHPEFLAFIRGQNKHLYVNLMKRHGMEGGLSKTLESLDSKEPSFAVVTLDKNSSFYWQEGDFPSAAAAFKELFLRKMLDGKDFFWSSQLSKNLETDLRLILNQVHSDYFHENSLLDQKDRQNFIELTYLAILDYLAETLHPDSMNITCKQAMDRAPSLAVLWQWKLGLAKEEELAALLFAPPLLVHNRPTHRSRLNRLILALEFFYPNNQ